LISSAQLRAARALLRWSALDLSRQSGVGTATIQRMEVMEGVPAGNVKTLISLKNALEAAGVQFLGSPDNAPGVCLTRVEKKC
jgi:DNA-binding Xre family transcriptional regulator